jgi:tetratricopeptide (TPR) repeat protein
LALALRMSFLPWPLVADYGPAGRPPPPTLLAMLPVGLALLGAVTLPWWRRRRGVALAFAWMLLTLLPVMNLLPIPQPRAERFLYLPTVGLVIGAAFCLERLRGRVGRWAWAPLLLLLPLAGGLTWRRLPEWRDEASLWESVLRVLPENPRALQNLAAAYRAAGEEQRALPLYARAYALAPRMEKVVLAYAQALHRQGRREEALEVLRGAVREGSGSVEVVGMLAASLARQGEYAEAAALFGRIVEARPEDGRARVSRALCWVALGRVEEAREELRRLQEMGVDPGVMAPLRGALSGRS